MKNKLVLAAFILLWGSCIEKEQTAINSKQMALINEYLGYFVTTYGDIKIWHPQKIKTKVNDKTDIGLQNKISKELNYYYNIKNKNSNLLKFKMKLK